MHDFGLAPGSMGLLLSAFFWTYGGFQLPGGWIIDRLGIRKSYFWAFVLWSLASAGMALARGLGDMFALRLLLGFAECVGPLASLTFIRLAFSERERGLPVSIYIAGQTIGPALGALLGTALLAHAGWRFMFAATGLGALLWTPFWLHFARFENKPAPLPVSAPAPTRWKWQAIFSNRVLWVMCLCAFLFSYYWYFVLTWIPTYLNLSRGFPIMTMGRILSIPLFIMAPLNIVVGWLADRLIAGNRAALRVRVTTAVLGFGGAGAVLLLSHARSLPSILAVLILSICSFGVGSTNFWAIVQHIAPQSATARTVGFFNTVSQAAGAVAPVITGYSLGPQKNFTFAITLAGLSTMGAALLLLWTGHRGIDRLKQTLSS